MASGESKLPGPEHSVLRTVAQPSCRPLLPPPSPPPTPVPHALPSPTPRRPGNAVLFPTPSPSAWLPPPASAQGPQPTLPLPRNLRGHRPTPHQLCPQLTAPQRRALLLRTPSCNSCSSLSVVQPHLPTMAEGSSVHHGAEVRVPGPQLSLEG